MFPYFEGKETEHNWLQREKSVIRIRGLLRGQAFSKHPDSFVSGLKAGGMEGVTKTVRLSEVKTCSMLIISS